jgi:hypothetical protein
LVDVPRIAIIFDRRTFPGSISASRRVTVSQLIRWAVNNIDFDEMPEIP